MDNIPVDSISYDQLTVYNFKVGQLYALNVKYNKVLYEFLVHLKPESEKLLVLGSGAIDRSKIKPPVFNRHSWSHEFDVSVVYYSDPTLKLGRIRCGWGYGTSKEHYLSNIAKLLSVMLGRLDIKKSNVYFYGSSAGGFMSLMLAGMLKDSKAIVNNPQTSFMRYHKNHINELLTLVHGDWRNKKIVKDNALRIDAAKLYKKINRIPNIYYIQNVACDHDMNNHMFPFLNAIVKFAGDRSMDKIHLFLYHDKKMGHNPLNKTETLKHINRAIRLLK